MKFKMKKINKINKINKLLVGKIIYVWFVMKKKLIMILYIWIANINFVKNVLLKYAKWIIINKI